MQRIRYSFSVRDGAVDPVYPCDEIELEAFELKLARWLCHHIPQTAQCRLAALDFVLFAQPGINDLAAQAAKYGVSEKGISNAHASMPHIPAIQVGWRSGWHAGFTRGLHARGMVREDSRRGVKAMLVARGLEPSAQALGGVKVAGTGRVVGNGAASGGQV